MTKRYDLLKQGLKEAIEMSKHNANRRDYPDSKIMDALDAGDYNINRAAEILGLHVPTLRNWIIKSENLSKYTAYKQAEGAVKAREKLDYMLDNLDADDPRAAGILTTICKTLMDKYEPDLLKSETDHRVEIDKALEDKINKLLGD